MAGLGLFFFRIHFTTDDYGALAACSPLNDLAPGARSSCWDLLGPVFSRIPAAVLIQYQLLKFQIWERFRFLTLFGYFAFHALSFGLLVGGLVRLFPAAVYFGSDSWVTRDADGGLVIGKGRGAFFFSVWAVAVLTLFPNNHEIHLFYSTAVHSLGALAVAGGFVVERRALRFFLYVLGGLFYETFFLLILGLEAFRALFTAKRPVSWRMATFKNLSLTLLVPLVVFLIRHQLAGMVGGSNARELSFGDGLFQRWIGYEKMLVLLNFRKDNWPVGSLEWLGILLSILVPFLSLKQQPQKYELRKGVPVTLGQGLQPSQIAVVILIPLLLASPLALLPYSAIRSLYGPNLVRQLGLALVILTAIASAFRASAVSERRALTTSLKSAFHLPRVALFLSLTCITVSYGFQWVRILKFKNANFLKLDRLEAQTRERLRACQSPCVLEVPRPDQGLESDWVIHDYYFPAYYERLRLLETPRKKVQFRIQPQSPAAASFDESK